MLRSFRYANHRSFRGEQQLSLLPVYDRREREALTVTALYGPNASGKSNVLSAMSFMADAVLRSYREWEPGGAIPRQPFRLAPRMTGEASWFAVDVVVDDVRYEYGFGVDDERVVEEWLHAYPQKKKRVLFARSGDDVNFGPSVTGPKAALHDLTRPGALLLTVAAHVGVDSLLPVYRWFRESVHAIDLSVGPMTLPTAAAYRQMVDRDPGRVQRLNELLKAADLGISGIREPEDAPQSMSEEEFQQLYKSVTSSSSNEHWGRRLRELRHHYRTLSAETSPSSSDVSALISRQFDRLQPLQLMHGDVSLPIADESAGTRNWLAFLWIGLPILEQGGVLIVDELDSRLHPLLTARLLQLFHSDDTNPRGAQLIFAAHDTSLLGTSLSRETLRRDEVWFVEKDADGASQLFPLAQFKPRHGENPERRYLGGSYGAVPFLDDEAFDGGSSAPVRS